VFQSAQHIVLGLSLLNAILGRLPLNSYPPAAMSSCEFASGKLPSKRNKVDEDMEYQTGRNTDDGF
jgi:hypothetical protein